ncbi:MAG: nucleoside triphosphate pyrophosphohydrolase family protein [Ferrovibrio sp.]|uniref:nucleoside triphosphate pyrophosphohydrolase family protein n=1 Tax=Ferrovibrio sp. TaxID=1917215 RepID=UPI00391B2CB4
MEFGEYQAEQHETDDTKKPETSVYGLASEIGEVLSLWKKKTTGSMNEKVFRDALEIELGDVLWYLSSVAQLHQLTLEGIAQRNIRKAKGLHAEGHNKFFDEADPKDEQLPRVFFVDFYEKTLPSEDGGAGRTIVKMAISGITIGDTLTDNSNRKDGYRYHDAFHLAYAAVLGWSPVIRALLSRKRKSDKLKDEIEDGARAIIAEEAVSLYVFNHKEHYDDFKTVDVIDLSLLKRVMEMVQNLEVRERTAKQWRQAIFQGYKLFHSLVENRGGRVEVNLDTHTVKYVGVDKMAPHL